MLEKQIESWCKKYARERGWYVRKFTSPANRSVPDDIFLKNGFAFWVEFKATGKKATDAQRYEHEQLIQHGAYTHVCDSKEQFHGILERMESVSRRHEIKM